MSDDIDQQFTRAVLEGLVPKIEGSAVCVSAPGEGAELDPHFAVQLGVMILLDKPIFAVKLPGVELSEKLRLVADEIFEGDLADPADHARFMEAVTAFAERHGGD